MRQLLIARCERSRDTFPRMGPIEGNTKWMRIRTPNYDSLVYSLLYCVTPEFRRSDIDKSLSITDLITKLNNDKQLNAASPLDEEHLSTLSIYFDVSVTVIEKNNSGWVFRTYGRNRKHVYIVKTSGVHYEPVAFHNKLDRYQFIVE